MLLSPIWDLDLGWNFGGPASLDPGPVHGDAVNFTGRVRDSCMSLSRLAPERVGSEQLEAHGLYAHLAISLWACTYSSWSLLSPTIQ